MGGMTAIMLGLGATQMIGGFMEGNQADSNARAAMSEANYNAATYEQQAGMIEEQKNLKIAQDKRQIRFIQGQTVAMTAHKGIELSGSPLAILVDSTTQMNMDMAINAYNYDMDKYAALSAAESTRRTGQTQAAQYRRAGDTARIGGVVGGLTTMFSAATPKSSFQTTPTKRINYGGGNTGYRGMSGRTGYGSGASAYRGSTLI